MIDTSGNNPVIQVNMFGGFTITMDNRAMSDSDNRSRKAWSLLSYLIVNRHKDVSTNELFNATRQEGIQDSPYGALKTLVSWVRKMVEAVGFPSQEPILNQKGTYMWSPFWKLTIDADRFEFLCKRILNSQDDMGDLESEWREALGLYKGTFFPKSTDENWVNPLHTYHHSFYQKLARAVSEDLMERGDYAQAEEICTQAVSINQFIEDLHYYLIYVAYKKGDQKKVLQNYRDTTGVFYRERLMTPSERFKEMYRVISDSEQEMITDLNVIQEALGRTGSCGEEKNWGTYQCEYAVFKRLVQLERHGVERSGDSVYLYLLTVGDRKGRTLKPEIQARVMERLRSVINSSLRSSDAFVRYSVSQFIILLPLTTYENGEQVIHRILSAFNKAYVRKDVSVPYSLNVVLPQEEILQ